MPCGSPWLGHMAFPHWLNTKSQPPIKISQILTNSERTCGSPSLTHETQSTYTVTPSSQHINFPVTSSAYNLQLFYLFGKIIKMLYWEHTILVLSDSNGVGFMSSRSMLWYMFQVVLNNLTFEYFTDPLDQQVSISMDTLRESSQSTCFLLMSENVLLHHIKLHV